jgi:hypothetical protein
VAAVRRLVAHYFVVVALVVLVDAGMSIGFATGVHGSEVPAAASLLFVLLELFAWRGGLGGRRARAQAAPQGESPDAAATSQTRMASGTLDGRPDKQHRDGILRVQTTDIDEGKRVVEGVLGVTAMKWRLRSFTPNGADAIVLEYECRLRRAYTPDAVRARLLYQGEPFVQVAEWQRSNRRPSRLS